MGKATQWHKHPDARSLIAGVKIVQLPGLDMTTRNRLGRAGAWVKAKRFSGLWWPFHVGTLCRCRESVEAIRDGHGVGPETVGKLTQALMSLGLEIGMGPDDFEDWKAGRR